ncbi:MAG TPA: CPBP family glutamic-type intramembrane protease, partial [Myxococcota bacterium]|nr:CPBP family glutamic-type intramembrane protease [Myxococcota bacterium]
APFRLAVFVPGLLFGWLRERTRSIVAPALLHAASNVLLAALNEVFY